MRIRLPVGRTLLFLGAFFLAMLALLPMRLAMDWFGLADRGLAAREVEGSVWSAALKETQFGNVGLGDMYAGLRGLPLLLGRAHVALDRAGEGTPAEEFEGAVTVTRNSFGFDDLTGRLALTSGALGPLPLTQIDLTDVTARFENGQCIEAAGTVRTMVGGGLGGLALAGGLTGTAQCDAGALLLTMVSQSGMGSVDLRLFGDGRYTGTALIRSTDPSMGERMSAAGLSMTPQGYGITINGSF